MNETWERWLKRASELPDAALDWGREGVAFLRSSLGGLPFFAATSVDTSKANPERDETHYFLIPDPGSDEGFSLAERRRLPEGVGSVNSLPKVRVFHVHDPAAVGVLEAQLLGRLVERPEEAGAEGGFADRLEAIGEEIDRKTNWVTGGLVLIGGVVAIANPVLGLGIAAKGLLPELGAKLTKFGLGTAADSIRSVGRSWRKGSARREAEAEIKRMKPELVVDPVLKFLDETVAAGERAEPAFRELERLPEWWLERDQRLSMSVVAEVLPGGLWGGWVEGVKARVADLEG